LYAIDIDWHYFVDFVHPELGKSVMLRTSCDLTWIHWMEQMRPNGFTNYDCVNKPIESCRVLLRPDLKALIVFDSTTRWPRHIRQFILLITCCEKKWHIRSPRQHQPVWLLTTPDHTGLLWRRIKRCKTSWLSAIDQRNALQLTALLTRKPCCRKETARCRKCSFPLKFANNIHYKYKKD